MAANDPTDMQCSSCEVMFGEDVESFLIHMSEEHADDLVQCIQCRETLDGGSVFAVHYMDEHYSGGSSEMSAREELNCPMCAFSSPDEVALTVHFDTVHGDGKEEEDDEVQVVGTVAAAKVSPAPEQSSSALICPVCDAPFVSENALSVHVNGHFDETEPQSVDAETQRLIEEEREREKKAEAASFRLLQEQFGMRPGMSGMQSAAYERLDRRQNGGAIGLGDVIDRRFEISRQQHEGTEDPTWAVSGFIDRIRTMCAATGGTREVRVCSNVSFFATGDLDQGFGCGFRNTQMLLSSLVNSADYRRAMWGDAPATIPSIHCMQNMIERAWAAGFDRRGAQQLGGKLVNTRKWIGATEIATLLHFHRIRTKIVDFHRPTGTGSSHPMMFQWIWDYFGSGADFIAPLYLQHQGHSRTVIGAEKTTFNTLRLLILDPSFARARVEAIRTADSDGAIAFLRRPIGHMKKSQFQIIAVDGLIRDDAEYERAKVFDGFHLRIPA
uniref:Zinc finger-containing ubiquitin peptidase 1 n=1 Tax=Plectus sambesii TaxID=2011161 RepID=A0A914XHQ7_9BILA